MQIKTHSPKMDTKPQNGLVMHDKKELQQIF